MNNKSIKTRLRPRSFRTTDFERVLYHEAPDVIWDTVWAAGDYAPTIRRSFTLER
jgi:hypothetical protein